MAGHHKYDSGFEAIRVHLIGLPAVGNGMIGHYDYDNSLAPLEYIWLDYLLWGTV